jgi:hypothetical protein
MRCPINRVHGFSQWAEQWFVETVEVQLRSTGARSATIQGEHFGPTEIKGYWSVIREGDDWNIRMLCSNETPAPAATPSPAPTPSSQ